MSQPKNSTEPAAAQLPAPLVTTLTPFHAPYTALGLKLFAVQDGVSASTALEQSACMIEAVISLLDSIDSMQASATEYSRAVCAALCILTPAKALVNAVNTSMVGETQYTTDLPGGAQ